MTLDQFEIQTDPDGMRFITQVKDEIDKNHGIDVSEPAKQGCMYKNPSKNHFFSLSLYINCSHKNIYPNYTISLSKN